MPKHPNDAASVLAVRPTGAKPSVGVCVEPAMANSREGEYEEVHTSAQATKGQSVAHKSIIRKISIDCDRQSKRGSAVLTGERKATATDTETGGDAQRNRAASALAVVGQTGAATACGSCSVYQRTSLELCEQLQWG